MRLDNANQSRFGVRRIRSSRSTSHSIGTSLSSQSASEAQNTRRRAAFNRSQLHFGHCEIASTSTSFAALKSSRHPQSGHEAKAPRFHRSTCFQFAELVRTRGLPAPHSTRPNRLVSRSA